jgi:mycofactocin precursor
VAEVGSLQESVTAWFGHCRHGSQNGGVRGGNVPTETLIEEEIVVTEEIEELLVEEVSIDGLCGVY